MSIIIRDEKQADKEAISRLIKKAFQDAPHRNGKEQFIVEKLRQAGQLTLSMLVEMEGVLIGYGAVSPVVIADETALWYGLGPVAIDPAWQRQGLGMKLITALLQELRHLGAAGCVVLGEPAYYKRFGFKADKGLVLTGVPPHYFLALPLAGPVPAGAVHYHAAFAD